MQTRSKRYAQESTTQDLVVDMSIPNPSRRAMKKRKTLVDEEPIIIEAQPRVVLPSTRSSQDEQEPSEDVTASLSLKPGAASSSTEPTMDELETILPLTSYQEKFGLFVQSFLRVQDEYNSIIDLINITAKRAEELKTRVNNLSFYFNYSSSEEEDTQQKKRRRDRVLYELRDIQTLSGSMQNDYTSLKHRLKYKYLVVLDEFCTSFKNWEEKHSANATTGAAVPAADDNAIQ